MILYSRANPSKARTFLCLCTGPFSTTFSALAPIFLAQEFLCCVILPLCTTSTHHGQTSCPTPPVHMLASQSTNPSKPQTFLCLCTGSFSTTFSALAPTFLAQEFFCNAQGAVASRFLVLCYKASCTPFDALCFISSCTTFPARALNIQSTRISALPQV